jgi:Rps23 Pro-64 3,4-dihydroxylase Tpa1-like proline 4-hydroxylase
MNRKDYAQQILARMTAEKDQLQREFQIKGRIQSCLIDNLLPNDLAMEIAGVFPRAEEMQEQKSIREQKFTAKQLDRYSPLIEEIVFAFQDAGILELTSEITGIKELQADPNLYAGGISLMANGNFLLPHIDNSHDKDRNRYRVLNLLYYVTPGWKKEYGGNFELWDNGPKGQAREIVSAFNRLVIMATHETSWHSVNEVKHQGSRCCISNYFFSKNPLENHEYFHVTTFRGRPDQPILDIVLQGDGALRAGVRKILRKGMTEPEVFKKKSEKA